MASASWHNVTVLVLAAVGWTASTGAIPRSGRGVEAPVAIPHARRFPAGAPLRATAR
jgi:hypothetical protein